LVFYSFGIFAGPLIIHPVYMVHPFDLSYDILNLADVADVFVTNFILDVANDAP